MDSRSSEEPEDVEISGGEGCKSEPDRECDDGQDEEGRGVTRGGREDGTAPPLGKKTLVVEGAFLAADSCVSLLDGALARGVAAATPVVDGGVTNFVVAL